MQVQDTVALVTGGASGLGRATAAALAQAGAGVVIADLPTSDGDRAAEELGTAVRFAPTDVRDEGDVQRAVDAASDLGPLRIVVNCAGVATPGRLVGKRGTLPLHDFTSVVDINLNGTFNVCRLAVARMLELDPVGEERGVLVNTASVAAFDGQVGQAAYAASKGGVAALTLPLAHDLASKQIRVVAIAPGIFATPMMEGLPEAAQQSLASQVPHPSRLGRPEEYAGLVAHIIANPMLNGETIRLDGAIRMAPR